MYAAARNAKKIDCVFIADNENLSHSYKTLILLIYTFTSH